MNPLPPGNPHSLKGFTNSDLLVVDFESRKQELISMREKIADLKQRHALLSSVVERAEGE